MALDLATVPKNILKSEKLDSGNVKVFCRISFPQVFEPHSEESTYDKGKYTMDLLIPPEVDLTALKEEARRVATETWGEDLKKLDPKPTSPFKDAGDKKYEGYIAGWTSIKVKSNNKPGIVDDGVRDPAGKYIPIKEDNGESVYGGRWAQVTLNAFGYKKDKKHPKDGISFSLNNIRLLYHDDSFSGRSRAEDEFSDPAIVEGSTGAVAGKAQTAADLF